MGIHTKEIWGSNQVVVHHGSLSKSERDETELVMKVSKRAICVSTMTLEIGIDIGDIDAVVLVDLWIFLSMYGTPRGFLNMDSAS